MMILALEFSSAQRSVAVFEGSGKDRKVSSEVVETGGRTTKAFEMIEEALRQAHVEREQIELLAVGLGPGSYTGVRAAISIAQGWQLAREVKLAGVSSADCVAAQAQSDLFRGPLGVVIDAQRNEFYLGQYDLREDSAVPTKPLRLVNQAEVSAVAAGGVTLAGPELARWFPEAKALFPRASMAAKRAALTVEYIAGEKLEPIYLRETQFVKAPPPREWPSG